MAAYFKCKGLPVYKWEKWNALPRYSYGTSWKSATGGNYYFEGEYSSHARGSNSMSFDEETGLFTVNNSLFTLNQNYALVCYNGSRNYGIRTSSQTQNSSTRLYNASQSGSGSNIGMITNMTRYAPSHTYQVHDSYISTYIQGSTDYGEVKSTNKNAYPTNGRHTDGYWYVLKTA